MTLVKHVAFVAGNQLAQYVSEDRRGEEKV